MILPEKKIGSKRNERIVSGLIYLSVLIPIGWLALLYVHFYYGKNSKFIRFHTNEAGFLWLIGAILYFIGAWFLIPFMKTFILPTNQNIFMIYGSIVALIVLLSLQFFVYISSIILSIFSFKGRCFRITRIIDFMKK